MMGATALLRIDTEKQIKVDNNVLDIPVEWMERFPEKLFNYMVEFYSVAKKKEETLQRYTKSLTFNVERKTKQQENTFKNYSAWTQKSLKDSLEKVIKYFEEDASIAQTLLSDMKTAFKESNMEEILRIINETIQLLKQTKINQKLTLNSVKAKMLTASGGQVSFLNVTKNSLTFKEQIEVFTKDFIEPILWEWKLKQIIIEKNEEVATAILQESEYSIAKNYRKAHKKSKTIDWEWFNHIEECSAIAEQWATLPYEEMMFMPLGSTSLNDRWDGQVNNIQQISAFARLLLFIAPLGCATYKRKFGRDEDFVFSFLHVEGDCQETLNKNYLFMQSLSHQELFSDALVHSYDKKKWLENEREKITLLVEWTTYSKEKKTLLEYRILNEKFIKNILKNPKINFSKIYPYEFREELMQQGLRGQDSKTLIIEEIYRLIKEPIRNLYSVRKALIMRELLIREDILMEDTTLTDRMYATGAAIRNKLLGKGNSGSDENYVAPQEKKLTAIVYRLLNASKGGNRHLFFDTAVRLHLETGRFIGKEFTTMLDKKTVSDSEFATMSLAFIAGLTPSIQKEDDIKEGASVNE